MSFRIRAVALFCLAALASLPARAQTSGWGLGASYGSVNEVSRRFSFDNFHYTDWNGWIQFETEDHVQLRGTYGSLKTRSGAEAEGAADAPPVTSSINYGTIGVAYEFWEGDYRSGIFAGVGAYQDHPDSPPPGFESLADPRRTVFGWHAGVDGSLRVISRLSVVGRVTLHRFRNATGRSLLTANGGLLYRF